MNKELIMKSDVLDIIFENRNKTYGAYSLRKLYPKRLKAALSSMLLACLVFSAITFFPSKKIAFTVVPYPNETELGRVKEEIKKQEVKQETVKPKKNEPPVTQKRFVGNPQIVPNNVITETIQAINENDKIGDKNVTTTNSGPATVQPVTTGNTGPVETPSPIIDKTQPLDQDAVDVLPSYPGGMEALRRFLQRNLNNPEEMEEGASVSVKVTFVVGYEGKLKGFKITEDGGEVFNKEVIRVLKKMPDWIPGKAKGENVSVYYTIPVKFTGAD
jgi:protein TonB